MNAGDVVGGYRILDIFKKEKAYFDHKYKVDRTAMNTMVTVECTKCGDVKTMHISGVKTQGCKQGPCHPKFIDLTGQRFG